MDVHKDKPPIEILYLNLFDIVLLLPRHALIFSTSIDVITQSPQVSIFIHTDLLQLQPPLCVNDENDIIHDHDHYHYSYVYLPNKKVEISIFHGNGIALHYFRLTHSSLHGSLFRQKSYVTTAKIQRSNIQITDQIMKILCNQCCCSSVLL
jgi:hypothetical protein